MASLKDLRNRIGSVKSTQKITKAMKMVAASKLRRAQEAAEAARPYAERMESVMHSLATKVVRTDNTSALLAGTGKDDVHLVVVATSERGLCGALNTNIVRAARLKVEALLKEGKEVKILTVGRKGFGLFRRTHPSLIIERMEFGGVKQIGYDHANEVAEKVKTLFEEGAFDVAWLFYAQFKSVLSQEVTGQQLIPVPVEAASGEGELAPGQAVYEYEPDEEQILNALLPRNVTIQIFRALLENSASEQGARMTAMDNATRNAGDMIDRLTLTYNRTRQAQITKELIEIISGAEAL
ncbi:MAG: F0F1 ATP synthase subunit gamma [Sphingomonadales bacterium]|jgi:F-type H+-transporting ATPase subunit gamma